MVPIPDRQEDSSLMYIPSLPNLGIMHEIYDCPPGNFENVYINFRPFGLRQTSFMIDGEKVGIEIRGGSAPAGHSKVKGEAKGEKS
jgi:hypothetical protein